MECVFKLYCHVWCIAIKHTCILNDCNNVCNKACNKACKNVRTWTMTILSKIYKKKFNRSKLLYNSYAQQFIIWKMSIFIHKKVGRVFFREKEKRWLVTLKSFHIFESTTLSHTLGLSNWTKVKSTVGPKHQEPKKMRAYRFRNPSKK